MIELPNFIKKSIHSSIIEPKKIFWINTLFLKISIGYENNFIIKPNKLRKIIFQKHSQGILREFLETKIPNLSNCLLFTREEILRVDGTVKGADIVLLVPTPSVSSVKKNIVASTKKLGSVKKNIAASPPKVCVIKKTLKNAQNLLKIHNRTSVKQI